MDKKTIERDWLKTFQQVRELEEQYRKGDEYAIKELSDIQMKQISSRYD